MPNDKYVPKTPRPIDPILVDNKGAKVVNKVRSLVRPSAHNPRFGDVQRGGGYTMQKW